FGYHIIQVLEKFPAGTASFDDVKSQINAYLLQQKQGTAVQDYVAGLKKGAEIKQLIQFS
ncbi:peptidylprolyl isomerase, partial [Salinispira pacifica]